MMKSLILFLALIVTATAQAAGGHGSEGIPTKTIILQVFNLTLALGFLIFVTRKTITSFFTKRAQEYKDLVGRAEAAKTQAEQQKREIYDRLKKLEQSADADIARAKKEAEELRQRIIREADEISRNLKEDVDRTVKIEMERAKLELRNQLLNEAIQSARKSLSENVQGADQKRLQSEFVEKIQAVK